MLICQPTNDISINLSASMNRAHPNSITIDLSSTVGTHWWGDNTCAAFQMVEIYCICSHNHYVMIIIMMIIMCLYGKRKTNQTIQALFSSKVHSKSSDRCVRALQKSDQWLNKRRLALFPTLMGQHFGLLAEECFVKVALWKYRLLGTQFQTFCDQITVLAKIPPHLIHRTCCCGKTFWCPLLVWHDMQSQPPEWSLSPYWVSESFLSPVLEKSTQYCPCNYYKHLIISYDVCVYEEN